jgi:hypothetical protein
VATDQRDPGQLTGGLLGVGEEPEVAAGQPDGIVVECTGEGQSGLFDGHTPTFFAQGGHDVSALATTPARAVLVTPAHQTPTGAVLAPERRAALLEWAAAVDGYVLEDDYDAEFRYDRQPVGALQGMAPDRVILLGSVSKDPRSGTTAGMAAQPTRTHG